MSAAVGLLLCFQSARDAIANDGVAAAAICNTLLGGHNERRPVVCATGYRLSTKQLLLDHPASDIAQQHPDSRSSFTTGRSGPRKPCDEGVAISEIVTSDANAIRELTIDELEEAGGGKFPPGPTLVDIVIFPVAGVPIHDYLLAIGRLGSARPLRARRPLKTKRSAN